MTTATYTVTGMTCGHFVSSVTEEISEIAGVSDVAVDLPTGAVTSDGGVPPEAVHGRGPRSRLRGRARFVSTI